MTFVIKALGLFLVAAICLQLISAQMVPDRCRCVQTTSRNYTLNRIMEFSVTRPRSRCKDTEIILTMKIVKALTNKKVQRCLDPKTELAKTLQECWDRVNTDRKETIQASECLQKSTERK
ncbi:chemokine (C-X-C motif) ligand 18b [Trichomycterus rosablanca]|uniref:chemokine (C-X-C motif) ligand 18b n=1 Tax=Trichomycterus rosablanca TaxID=2290929 RepID=UPI002F355474